MLKNFSLVFYKNYGRPVCVLLSVAISFHSCMIRDINIRGMKLNEEMGEPSNIFNEKPNPNMEVTQVYLQEDTSRQEEVMHPEISLPKGNIKKSNLIIAVVAFFFGYGLNMVVSSITSSNPTPNYNFASQCNGDLLACNNNLEISVAESLECNREFQGLSKVSLDCNRELSKCTNETFSMVNELRGEVLKNLEDHSDRLTKICNAASASSCAGSINLSSCSL